MKFLPVLIPCSEPARDGTVNGKPVRVVPYGVVDLLIEDRSTFHKKHGDLPEVEEKWLRGFWHIVDALRGGRKQKLKDVALGLAQLAQAPNLSGYILKDPLHFVEERLSQRAGAASLVLWRARSKTVLNAGIFCEGGMLDAMCALMLFRIGVGDSGGTGSCVICGTIFERKRGDRRRTCSDKCRKRASRMMDKAAAPADVT